MTPLRLTKRAKIILLLQTYPDVCDAARSEDDVRAGKPASGVLHRGQLWHEGSYAELELCLDYLRTQCPRVRWHLLNYYNPSRQWKAGMKARKGMAELGVSWLERMLENVYVPAAISENAGYGPSEVKGATKPRLLSRAA